MPLFWHEFCKSETSLSWRQNVSRGQCQYQVVQSLLFYSFKRADFRLMFESRAGAFITIQCHQLLSSWIYYRGSIQINVSAHAMNRFSM